MNDFQIAIVAALQTPPSTPLTVSDLALKYSEWHTYIYNQLLSLWKMGVVYSSKVIRTPGGYIPPEDTLWCIKREEGYYGYSQQQATYQIEPNTSEAPYLTLEATLYIGTPIVCIAIAPNGNDFAVGDQLGNIWIGEISQAGYRKRISAHTARVWALDYSPIDDNFVSVSQDGNIILWSLAGEQLDIIGKVDYSVTSAQFSPDGKSVLTGIRVNEDQEHPNTILWSVERKERIANFNLHKKNVYSVRFLPDGTGFVSGGSDNRVVFCSLDEEQNTKEADKHEATVNCIDISHDGKIAASGAWTGTIKLWDLAANEILHTIEAHNSRVTALRYTPSGCYLVSGSRDAQIAVWGIPDGNYMTSIPAHAGWVRALAFAADGATLLSGGSDGMCKIWSFHCISHTKSL